MRPFPIILMLLALTAFTTAPKEIKLQYVFKVGDQYALIETVKQTIKESMPGMGDLTVEMNVESTLRLKVVSFTTTGAKLEASYEQMKIDTKLPMGQGDMKIDSNGEEDNAQNKVIKSMMNKTFSLTMTKQGVIEKVEGVENLYSDFESLGLDEATLSTFKENFQQMMSDKSIKALLEQVLISYPAKKIKTGDTWLTTSESKVMTFSTQIARTWSLKGTEATKTLIQADGTVATVDKNNVFIVSNGVKSKIDVNGKQSWTGSINPKTGWPMDIKTNSTVKGIMTLLAGGMIPADIEVPIETVMESTHKLVKK